MTTIDTNRPHRSGSSLGSKLSAVFGAFTAWNDARITRKALSQLTSRELNDIGLTYSDISEIASNGRR